MDVPSELIWSNEIQLKCFPIAPIAENFCWLKDFVIRIMCRFALSTIRESVLILIEEHP